VVFESVLLSEAIVWRFSWLKSHPWVCFCALLCLCLHLALTLLLIPLARQLESLFQGVNLSRFMALLGLILGVYAAKGFFYWIQTLLWGWLAYVHTHQCRLRIYQQLLRQPLWKWQSWQTGDLLSRLSSDLQQMEGARQQQLAHFFPNLILSLALLGSLLWMNVGLTLLTLLLLPLGSRTLVLTGRPLNFWARQQMQGRGALHQELSETFQALPSLWPLRIHTWLESRVEALQQTILASQIRQLAWQAIQGPLLTLIQVLAIGLVLIAGIWQVEQKWVTGGDLLAFGTALALGVDPVLALVQAWGVVHAAQPAQERIQELEAFIPEDMKETEQAPVGKIQTVDLGFAYPEQPPLFNALTLVLEPGSWAALAGPSGCGKSSLLAILAGQLAATQGKVQTLPEALRVVLVPQKAGFFNRSLRENICLGREISEAEWQRLLQVCQLETVLAALPEGAESLMGNQGSFFSGGERQRVALARALLAQPAVLLLDEATSELDLQTEALIFAALRAEYPDMSCLLVSHRPETLAALPQVFVFERGTIRTHSSPVQAHEFQLP